MLDGKLTGSYMVEKDPVTLKATIHAGSTGLTGLTGCAARVRACNELHDTVVT